MPSERSGRCVSVRTAAADGAGVTCSPARPAAAGHGVRVPAALPAVGGVARPGLIEASHRALHKRGRETVG